jgi:predicted phosphodiesterase
MKILILSDIHANWPALRAVLQAEPTADEILCLGDLVDYGPQPVGCVEWAMRNVAPDRLIQGNHDWGVAENQDPRCSPPYRHLTQITQQDCLNMLGNEQREFLGRSLPFRSFQLGGASWAACHAAPSDPLFRYLRVTGRGPELEMEIETAGNPDFLFFGHTHWPVNLRCGRTLVVNPGSLGQPKDGDPRAAYAIWQDGEVTLKRAAYDVEETIRAYEATPFAPEDIAALAAVLRSGGTLAVPEPAR